MDCSWSRRYRLRIRVLKFKHYVWNLTTPKIPLYTIQLKSLLANEPPGLCSLNLHWNIHPGLIQTANESLKEFTRSLLLHNCTFWFCAKTSAILYSARCCQTSLCVYVAALPQTSLRLKGKWGGPAGVPAHVHCLAWVDVLGIVSAEFLSGAVTDADRRDLPLALLLFGQVFFAKETIPACFQLKRSQVKSSLQGGRKEHHWGWFLRRVRLLTEWQS